MPPIFFWDFLGTPFFRNIVTFSMCSTPKSAPPPPFVFSHQTPSCAAVSCIFSSRLHYCLFLQLHCVCLSICMQRGTFKRTCSFLFTAPPTSLILNFFREWPVPFYSPFASYQQSLRAKMERGNSYSQSCLLGSFLISFCCCLSPVVYGDCCVLKLCTYTLFFFWFCWFCFVHTF